MITQEITINAKLQGVIYELTDGRKLYLAHMTPGRMNQKKMAWCLDESVLRKCQTADVKFVGVILREGSKKSFYLTPIEDFYDSAKSFQNYGKQAVERGLPVKNFVINPFNSATVIARRAMIGR